jgi:hypothetical protein
MDSCFYCDNCGVLDSDFCENCNDVTYLKPLHELSLDERFMGLIYEKQTWLDRRLRFLVYDLTDSELFFVSYLALIEDFLESEVQNRHKIIDERHEKYKNNKDRNSMLTLMTALDSHELQEMNDYAQLLRRSFFVSLFSFFEVRLVNFCRLYGANSDRQFHSVLQAKDYLSKELNINLSFGSSPEWNEIQQYRHIRNCIVHFQGSITGMELRKRERLESYVNRQSVPLSLSDNVIILHKDFCHLVSRVIKEFFWSLLVSVSDDFIVERSL